jgi:hypothetical protein
MSGFDSLILDFVEGRLSGHDFIGIMQSCPEIIEMIAPMNTVVFHKLSSSTNDIWNAFAYSKDYLVAQNTSFVPTKYYNEKFSLLLDIIPDYLDGGEAEAFIETEIFDKAPSELSKTALIKHCKARIGELFVCLKTKPKWLQNGDWAFDSDGKPLVFSHQESIKEGGHIKCLYHFIDKKRDICVVKEQYD